MSREMTETEKKVRGGGNYTTVPNGVAMEKTTFWYDFTIAEKISGAAGVRDTFERAFSEWKKDIQYLTPLYITMNWKGGEHYGKNDELSKLYYGYQMELDRYILDCEHPGTKLEKFVNFTEDEVSYFYQATD